MDVRPELDTASAPVHNNADPKQDILTAERPVDERFSDEMDELDYDGLHQTKRDAENMYRMGKQQELKRNFRALSTLSFVIVLQSTWEFILISITQGLNCGGTAGLIYSFIWTLVGFTPIILSLAEMASMAPTSGGQYHWVSEFAPPRFQKILSYMSGWQSTLAWQAGTASGSFLAGTIVQGLIGIANPNYVATGWQGTLLVFAFVLLLLFFNIFCADGMPVIQNILLIFHVFMFVAVVVCLWVLAPHRPADEIFGQFYNGGGWSSMGLALMVGQISAIFGSLGTDAAAHMSEEVKNAGMSVPRAMVWSFYFNFGLGLVVLISFCFAMPSVTDALNDPSGYPFLYVFNNAMVPAGTYCLTAGILVLLIASNISYNASTARQTWAFARDGGLIFNRWLAKVDKKRKIPTNAIIFSCAFTCVLSLINIGSTEAFNAIISLNTVALMLTYTISISCVLYRRVTAPDSLPPARWTLGAWGIPLNVLGVLYAVFACFWCFWPNYYQPSLGDQNWSFLIFAVVFLASVVVYVVRGRKMYTAPVFLVKGVRRESNFVLK